MSSIESLSDEEIEAFEEAMDEQMRQVCRDLVRDLGGKPSDYTSRPLFADGE